MRFIVVHYKLLNNVGDAFFKFLHIHANFPKRTLLPPSTRIGLQFLDNLKKKHTLFNSIPIINISNIQYNFEYRPILSGIEEIVSNAEIAEELVFDYNEIWINQEDAQKCSYSEMFNCNWWKQAVNHAPYGKSSKQMKETKEFHKAIRITFHNCFRFFLLQSEFNIKQPENGKYCLTYDGSKCKNPCHNCLVDWNNLNKIKLDN
ncbi:unnamed protein product [Rhizophagus irregularis]|nr:unnamed protein product [Rhizophagus irregularis]